MNELLIHYNNLITILQKMSNNQLQELGIVNEQLELITKEAESLKNQIEYYSKIAAKVNEEIFVYNKYKK